MSALRTRTRSWSGWPRTGFSWVVPPELLHQRSGLSQKAPQGGKGLVLAQPPGELSHERVLTEDRVAQHGGRRAGRLRAGPGQLQGVEVGPDDHRVPGSACLQVCFEAFEHGRRQGGLVLEGLEGLDSLVGLAQHVGRAGRVGLEEGLPVLQESQEPVSLHVLPPVPVRSPGRPGLPAPGP
ncbi:MAG TPA: hypothetical protein DGR79_06075 [Clostridiales bacterium]|nr:hypothetical protein [Clostridiales bacterium]